MPALFGTPDSASLADVAGAIVSPEKSEKKEVSV
jgi:hypothetical protein